MLSERTLLIKRVNLETHIYPALGDKRLSKLTARDIRCVFKGKDLKPATVNKILGTFSQALNDAVGKYLRSNPCREIKKLKQPKEETTILSPCEVKRLLDAAKGDRLEGIIVLGAYCGSRGEGLQSLMLVAEDSSALTMRALAEFVSTFASKPC